MSSVVLSRFELEAIRKAQLEKERMEKIAAVAELEFTKTRLAKFCEEMEKLGKSAINAASAKNMGEYLFAEINEVIAEAKKKAAKYNFEPKEEKDEIKRQTLEVNEAINQLESDYGASLEQKINALNKVIGRHEDDEKFSAFGKSLRNASYSCEQEYTIGRGKAISQAQFPAVSSGSNSVRSLPAENLSTKKTPVDISPLYEEASEFLESDSLGKYKKNAQKILSELQKIKNSNNHNEYARLNDSFYALMFEAKKCDKVYMEYKALCKLLKLPPKEICLFADIQNISAEVSHLKAKYSESNVREYISESVNNVMQDLGFDIISSDYVEKRQDLLYEFADDAGIEVFISDDGTVMMQVVAVGDDEKLTGKETQNLVGRMADFCERYPEIESALKSKGVLLKQEKIHPPHAAFARKCNIEKSAGRRRRRTSGTVHKEMP